MPFEFTMKRRVAFRETDAAGIVHFANFFHWMEDAEHAFFRSLGFSIHTGKSDDAVGWPRVHASCDYKAPLNFEDEAEIHLRVKEKRSKSLAYSFVICKIAGEQRIEVARGELVTVCVAWDEKSGAMKAVPIPAAIAEKIEAAPSAEQA